MLFDTKIELIIRNDLALWQKMNVAAFLVNALVKPILAILAHEQEEAISFGRLIERANVSC